MFYRISAICPENIKIIAFLFDNENVVLYWGSKIMQKIVAANLFNITDLLQRGWERDDKGFVFSALNFLSGKLLNVSPWS